MINTKQNNQTVTCERCHLDTTFNPYIVHGEDGDPLQKHCTFCTYPLITNRRDCIES